LIQVRMLLADRVLPIDEATAEAWTRLSVAGPLPPIDGLLTATAAMRGLTLVPGNAGDVARTGILDPFNV
jgi:predicted nucleic acid-binding protein